MDLLTINVADRQYIQISKQILQYEMKRKRIDVRSLSEQAHLEDNEFSLPTSVMSDWRVILQDSITTDDLRQGCISLFDQVNTEMNLTPIEVNHASRFLKYACKDIKYRGHPHDILLETIFPNETERQTSLVSSLINLLSLPSDTLRTDVLSFFDIGLSQLTYKFSVTVTNTRLTPKLFSVLKPQEIPLCDATMTFHRHLTSILDELFHNSPPEALFICFMNDYYPSHKKEPIFKIIESIFQPFCTYLRYLVTAPVCTTDHCSGYALLSNMRQFDPVIIKDYARSSSPEISRFFGEIRKDMMAEMVPMLGLSSTSEAEHYLNYRQKDVMNIPCWMEAFECLLARVSEGRQLSDFGADAVMNFLLQIPKEIHLVFWSDGTFTLKMEVPPKCHMLDAYGLTKRDKIISSPKLDSNSLWKLFTPSHRHQAAIVLAAFHNFMEHLDNATFLKHVWNSWFPSFVNAISPSTLPFTADFIRLLTNLITVLNDHLTKIRRFECQNDRSMTDQLRSNLDETYHAFYKQTKDYVIHLSHHPFTLKDFRQDTILEFLNKTYLHDFEDSLSKPYRDGVRQEMDASTLASSSPPFILTSELVCGHTDAEIIEIIDRIVALLESDSCLNDDTILRICVFHKRIVNSLYLPDLFRKAGRTNEQFFHAFESLLSLPVEFWIEHQSRSSSRFAQTHFN